MNKNKLKKDCLFCKVIRGEIPANIVYQDEKILVFKDINPRAKVHLLIIPKYHIDSLNDFNKADSPTLIHILSKLKPIAKLSGLKGYRIISNIGAEGGQEVFHMHLHLLGGDLKTHGFNSFKK